MNNYYVGNYSTRHCSARARYAYECLSVAKHRSGADENKPAIGSCLLIPEEYIIAGFNDESFSS